MNELNAHPYTQAVLDAWKRFIGGAPDDQEALTDDFPGLVGQLFVLHQVSDGDYSFRRVGKSLEQLFGRELSDHNFLSLWSDSDRQLVSGALQTAKADQGPVRVRARGESLDGRRIDLEIALAPLQSQTGKGVRFLGICQSLSGEERLAGRPVRRMQAYAVFPPAPMPAKPMIHVVA